MTWLFEPPPAMWHPAGFHRVKGMPKSDQPFWSAQMEQVATPLCTGNIQWNISFFFMEGSLFFLKCTWIYLTLVFWLTDLGRYEMEYSWVDGWLTHILQPMRTLRRTVTMLNSDPKFLDGYQKSLCWNATRDPKEIYVKREI